MLRPAVAQERLELLRITLKKAYADGTIAVEVDPLSLLCRLAASAPPPRRHTICGRGDRGAPPLAGARGTLSDRLARRLTILAGWSVYALAYAGFALARRPAQVFVLFAVYGVFHALTEGPERALVANLPPPEARGRALGWFHAVTGAMLLPVSLLTDVLWQSWGATTALGAGAALAAPGLLVLVPEPRTEGSELASR